MTNPRYERGGYEGQGVKREQQQQNAMRQYPPQQEKYIGGFPAEFCSFAPEYHKI